MAQLPESADTPDTSRHPQSRSAVSNPPRESDTGYSRPPSGNAPRWAWPGLGACAEPTGNAGHGVAWLGGLGGVFGVHSRRCDQFVQGNERVVSGFALFVHFLKGVVERHVRRPARRIPVSASADARWRAGTRLIRFQYCTVCQLTPQRNANRR